MFSVKIKAPGRSLQPDAISQKACDPKQSLRKTNVS